jgi:subtilisin family serine protease
MKLRGFTYLALAAVLASSLSATSAEARMTPNNSTPETSNSAVGLIVKYKPAVNPIAPNGEPTGENFAGVDLENSVDLGSGFKSVEFADDLTADEVAEAVERISLDPRVESASPNQVVEIANYSSRPIAPSILPGNDPIDLPVVIRSAVKVAAAPATVAADAWQAPNTVAVKLTWTKPTTRISGKLAGYKIQLYANGTWITLQSRTSSTARSYTTTNSHLEAGTQAKFRLAAVSYYSGRYYTGAYRTIYATPTALPKPNTHIQVENAASEVRFTWDPLTDSNDVGGLQVSYQLSVVKNDNVAQTCSTSTSTSCAINPATVGARYTATLTITNDRGSVTVGPITITYTLAAAVNLNDTEFTKQWHLKSDVANPYGMKVTNAWLTESGSPDVYVAVLDTGITDHPDLNSNVVAGYDMVSDSTKSNDGDGRDANPADAGDWDNSVNPHQKSSWHGTHVAGIIAAIDNNIGVLGVAPNVKLIPVRVLATGGGTEADIVAGLNWAAGIAISGIPTNPHPANVINMSIGGEGTCLTGSPTQSALVTIRGKGITVVTASGNDSGEGLSSYPGNCYPTINVAATGKTGKPTFYSNFGNAVDIAAPGGDYCYAIGAQQAAGQIYSTLNDGTTTPGNATYGYELGTSMASPNVAGVVALMYSALLRKTPTVPKNGDLVTKMWTALSTTVTPLAATAPPATPISGVCGPSVAASQNYGAGIVNAEAAVAAILQ